MGADLLQPGEIVRDTWRIDFVIGQGGMGTAYQATDLKSGGRVAIKALSPLVATDDSLVRFEREAALLGQFQHPSIVRILWVGRQRDVPVIAMDFIEGSSLRSYARARGDRLPLVGVLPLAQQMCSALSLVHSKGVVHRDLKPANILVNSAGQLTLLDFGIARPHDSTLTKTGVVWGTPGYIAPEVIVGEKVITGASDQYAVGAILYELLTGQMPFEAGEDEERLLRAHLLDPRPDPCALVPELPRAVGIVIQRAMATQPKDRFPTIGDLYGALADAAIPKAPPKPRGTTGPQPTRALEEAEPATIASATVQTEAEPATTPSAPIQIEAQRTIPRTRTDPNAKKAPSAARPKVDADATIPRKALKLEQPDRYALLWKKWRFRALAALLLFLAAAIAIEFLNTRSAGPPPPKPLTNREAIVQLPSTDLEQHQSGQIIEQRHTTFEQIAQSSVQKEKAAGQVRPRIVRQKAMAYEGPTGVGELALVVLVKGVSTPSDVVLDGKPIGQSPLFLPVNPGGHSVVIHRRPFPENVLPIEVKPGMTTKLEVELTPYPGSE